jgi:hypothetical protein
MEVGEDTYSVIRAPVIRPPAFFESNSQLKNVTKVSSTRLGFADNMCSQDQLLLIEAIGHCFRNGNVTS